jgi:hypothetical protein
VSGLGLSLGPHACGLFHGLAIFWLVVSFSLDLFELGSLLVLALKSILLFFLTPTGCRQGHESKGATLNGSKVALIRR